MPVAGCEHWMCEGLRAAGKTDNGTCPRLHETEHQAKYGGLSTQNFESFVQEEVRLAEVASPQPCLVFQQNPKQFRNILDLLAPVTPDTPLPV